MTAPHRKKLIEVALPLEAINIACGADKDRKTGHIRNLHKWFAPMPLPALRAVIFATLVDAPSSPEERSTVLAELVALLASGPLPPPDRALATARKRIEESVGNVNAIQIFDPFCGGGSTIVEAQRFGLGASGSDLNPIPVLITKALTELPQSTTCSVPVHRSQNPLPNTDLEPNGFLSDVTYYAKVVREKAFAALQHFYPPSPNGDSVIAWWWANTVASPDPSIQSAHTPLVSNWQLSKQTGKHLYVKPNINKDTRTIHFTIESGTSILSPSNNRCLFSSAAIPFSYVRSQGQERKLGTMLLATIADGKNGREFFPPDQTQIDAALAATPKDPPDLPIELGGLGIRVTNYGLTTWDQVFSPRQQLCLETFAAQVAEIPEIVVHDGGSLDYGNTIATILGLCVGKLSQACSKNVQWRIRNGPTPKAEVAFSRADLPFMWDFAETNPFGGSVGDWLQVVTTSLRAFEFVKLNAKPSHIVQSDARVAKPMVGQRVVVITDPPYFDAIG